MADVVYSESMTREEPYMEAMRRGLLQDVRGLQANRFGYSLVDKKDAAGAIQTDEFGYPIQSYEKILDKAGEWVGPAYEPDYQVAELTPEQRQASAQAQAGTWGFYALHARWPSKYSAGSAIHATGTGSGSTYSRRSL